MGFESIPLTTRTHRLSYPGRLMTTPEPFPTNLEMWAAFEALATNKTPAVNGSCFRAISSGGHVTYTSSPSAPTQQAHSRGSGSHAQCSPLNSLVMHVANNDADPFCRDDPDWPLRNNEEVYMVTTTFSTPDPPLLTRSSRARPALKPFVLTVAIA